MNSVDTGWVTDEDPAALAARKREEHGFHPPLDIVDGAARICDPIFSGLEQREARVRASSSRITCRRSGEASPVRPPAALPHPYARPDRSAATGSMSRYARFP